VDHETALTTHASERYLLGELSPTEAQEFELHFFSCAACAAAVEEGQRLMSEVRQSAHPRDGDSGTS
jgi:anti-sigma factor RsiW